MVATKPVDFRKSAEGLAALVRETRSLADCQRSARTYRRALRRRERHPRPLRRRTSLGPAAEKLADRRCLESWLRAKLGMISQKSKLGEAIQDEVRGLSELPLRHRHYRSPNGRRQTALYVALVRAGKFAFVKLPQRNRQNIGVRLTALVRAVPYKIHNVLTDNGVTRMAQQQCLHLRQASEDPEGRINRQNMDKAATTIQTKFDPSNAEIKHIVVLTRPNDSLQ